MGGGGASGQGTNSAWWEYCNCGMEGRRHVSAGSDGADGRQQAPPLPSAAPSPRRLPAFYERLPPF
jgi:hypothetical protein